jgi:hypothetical protein
VRLRVDVTPGRVLDALLGRSGDCRPAPPSTAQPSSG